MWQQQLKAQNGQNNLISRDCKQKLNQKANSKNENRLSRQSEGGEGREAKAIVEIKPSLNWDAIFQQLRNKQAGNGQWGCLQDNNNKQSMRDKDNKQKQK